MVVFASQVRAGGDKVVFPEGFDKGVLFTTVDRADNKQYREFYTSQAAVDAAKKGQPMPDGTVITLVQYRAKLGADGNPEKDANGRFIKGDLQRLHGDGEAQGLGHRIRREDPQRRVGISGLHAGQGGRTPNAKLTACFECHKPLPSGEDFVFRTTRWRGSNCRPHGEERHRRQAIPASRTMSASARLRPSFETRALQARSSG